MEEIKELIRRKEQGVITIKERNRLWYLENREKKIKQSLEWGKNHPNDIKKYRIKYRRTRIFHKLCKRANKSFAEKISTLDLWRLAKKQRLVCALTGDRLTKNNISLDHIKPKSKGGLNVIDNIRLTTKDANWLKNTHTDQELLELCKKIVSTLTK